MYPHISLENSFGEELVDSNCEQPHFYGPENSTYAYITGKPKPCLIWISIGIFSHSKLKVPKQEKSSMLNPTVGLIWMIKKTGIGVNSWGP